MKGRYMKPMSNKDNSAFKEGDFLEGTRYWIQIYQNIKIKFQIFKYIGTNINTGMHYFVSVDKGKAMIFKNCNQINTETFRPFLLDTSRLEKLEAKKATKEAA